MGPAKERRRTERAPLCTAAVAALALSACVPGHGPLMKPGSDCLSCHAGQTHAKRWTVAGTLYATPYTPGSGGIEGAHVEITDVDGRSISLRTNRVGNFYTAEHVVFPLRLCAHVGGRTTCMEEPVTVGSCNVCHGPNGAASPSVHARWFPIGTGTPHAPVTCAECHGTGSGPAAHECASCHTGLDPDLEPRHVSSTYTSNPLVTVSPNDFALQSAVCLRCHGDGQVPWTADHPSPAGAEGGYPPHHGATCLTCHDQYRADKDWAADFLTSPWTWSVSSGSGCYHCHTGPVTPTGDTGGATGGTTGGPDG